ncbi:MAG: hypothetical protein KDC98_25000, partial [Planctomycetes bacterium]|nr:hypothetical protein [Planctomycetota bacterium]
GVMPIYVTGGGLVDDVTLPLPMPFPVGPPMNAGIAYVGAPATNPPGFGASCPCPSYAPGPRQSTTSVMSAGNPAWGIRLGGLPPSQLVLFAFDFRLGPTWLMLNVNGCPIGFALASRTLVTSIAFTGPGGTATFPMPLWVPPRFGPIYNQNFAFCSGDPAGFVATPMQSIWGSGL